ncbi:hypothetical protein HHE02_13010 [Helicobacter heilmannii]|nr:hypothetical protein HHE02_13010 [Helicobacter heilmannii]
MQSQECQKTIQTNNATIVLENLTNAYKGLKMGKLHTSQKSL